MYSRKTPILTDCRGTGQNLLRMISVMKEEIVALKLVVEMSDNKYMNTIDEKYHYLSEDLENFYNNDINMYKDLSDKMGRILYKAEELNIKNTSITSV